MKHKVIKIPCQTQMSTNSKGKVYTDNNYARVHMVKCAHVCKYCMLIHM